VRVASRGFIRFPFLNFPCNNPDFCDIHSLYTSPRLALHYVRGKGLVPQCIQSDEEEGIRKA
jgi:hypothetical protein